ncbi:hypothetical protein Dimus_000545 [Dionaea muscipula]
MEMLTNTCCTQRCFKPSIFNPKAVGNLPLSKMVSGFFPQKLEFGYLKRGCRRFGRNGVVGAKSSNDKKREESQLGDWELKFLGELYPSGSQSVKRKNEEKSKLLEDADSMDWCVRARKVALRSIEARGMMQAVEDLVGVDKVKKSKKNKKKRKKDEEKSFMKVKVGEEDDDLDLDSEDEIEWRAAIANPLDRASDLRRSVRMLGDGMFEERKHKSMEEFVDRLSRFNGPSDRNKEINLNKAIVEAQTAEDVLEIVSEMIIAVGKGLSPSPLSPLNIATALHRIAKNMEKVSMMRTHRLAFARQRETSMLVGVAMTALPECSCQGISNIAWALSKIGGELLYLTEMDRVAEVALTRVGDFNSQNFANIAGAFASMKHSASDLFSELSIQAAKVIHTFHAQELAQLLWAFASLNEPAGPLLESLDNVFTLEGQLRCCSNGGASSGLIEDGSLDISMGVVNPPVLTFNRDQLGNIAWSYAVLGQMHRNFFLNVWKALSRLEGQPISDQCRKDVIFASQVLLVDQCLMLEYPHLHISLRSDFVDKVASAGKAKRFNEKITSLFQKEVDRLLCSTGLDWVTEYTLDAYTLDAALVDYKVALEIDGPNHFSRNSGVPLGHTMLKRRYITSYGWKLVSVSHQDWEELEGSSQQLEYLRELLKDITAGGCRENLAETGARS